MAKEPVSLVFNTGDISNDGGADYQTEFYPVAEELLKSVPYFPAVGNHDIRWNSPGSRIRFRDFFRNSYDYLARLPINRHLKPVVGNQRLWYAFTYNDVLFVVLDSNLFIDEGKYRRTHSFPEYEGYAEERLIWVRDLLTKSQGDESIKAAFVFFHHSPFVSEENERKIPFLPIGGHPGHGEMVVNQQVPGERQGERMYLLDLFRKTRVNAVFTGHEHYYERWTEVIRQGGRPQHQINWVVNGMGGVTPRGKPEYEESELDALVSKKEHFVAHRERISSGNPTWSSEFRHAFPNDRQPEARFHNYMVVTIDGPVIRFETKDVTGKVRDQGYFSLEIRSRQSTLSPVE